jgi:serine/threonine-protein phosphatase 2A regulatory subunit B
MNGGQHVNIRDERYIRTVSIPVIKYMDRIEVEAVPKRIFANAHTYHINSISLNSDQETFMSADDLRINLWHNEVTNQSFSEFIWTHNPTTYFFTQFFVSVY